jgi:hypothetical protein
MLRVSQAQRSKVGDPAFFDRIAVHLGRYRARVIRGIPKAVLRRRIAHGVEKGRSYGLTWEYSLTVFVAHMIVINPGFDEHPAVQRVLHDPGLEPDKRIDALYVLVTDDEWDAAGVQRDPKAYWQPIDAAMMAGED